MQQILNVTVPATATPPGSPYDLVTLDEMKMKLMIDPSNTAFDGLLSELITNMSETIARMCNRVFIKEAVEETFYQLNDGDGTTQRLYLSRWPVKLADITAITQNGVDILPNNVANSSAGQWVLEEITGTLYQPSDYGAWYGTVDVDYAGGYAPSEVPGTLKFCVESLLRENYMSWIRNPSLFGVRLISHKESHVGYYAPNMFPTAGVPATWTTVNALLAKYIRHWV